MSTVPEKYHSASVQAVGSMQRAISSVGPAEELGTVAI